MELADLTVLSAPPYWLEFEGDSPLLPPDVNVLAVGWMGQTVPTTGAASSAVVERLFLAERSGEWVRDRTRGFHKCELCAHPEDKPSARWQDETLEIQGRGFYLIRHEDTWYAAPRLLLHYLLEHHYLPPSEFRLAVVSGTFVVPPPSPAPAPSILPSPKERFLTARVIPLAGGALVAAAGWWLMKR